MNNDIQTKIIDLLKTRATIYRITDNKIIYIENNEAMSVTFTGNKATTEPLDLVSQPAQPTVNVGIEQ